MMRKQLAPALAAFSVVVAVLAWGLRPDAFFVGDPGVKLLSARNALRYPSHPLNIPLPAIAGKATPHVENFFVVHGDHSHAVTSELFPLLSAPLLSVAGVRGLYILPALGFIVTLGACAWLSRVLDTRRDTTLVVAAAALGTPLLFYGLEFWEHTPALAAGVSGVALLLDAARRGSCAHSPAGTAFAAGLLCGAATVLRPEAACFVIAAGCSSRTLVHRPSWRLLGIAAAGAGLALLPLQLYTIIHFGSLMPGHVGTNAALLGGHWSDERLRFAADWLIPSFWNGAGPLRSSSLWSVAPAAVLGLASWAVRPERGERAFLWLVALLTTALVIVVAPNDGGGQWGPRYLLFTYVPLVLLATDVLQAVPRRTLGVAALVLLLAACVWVQRAMYRQLRGAKATYGRLVDFVGATTTAGAYVVTDAWWLDQLAASALDDRTLLYAGDTSTGRDIVKRLSDATVPAVTVFRSREQSDDVDSWAAGTCYFEEAREETRVRQLVAVRLRHRCGFNP